MSNGNNNDSVRRNAEKKTVGKAINQTTSNLLVYEGLQIWIGSNKADCFIKLIKEFIAQANGLLFIPGKGIIKLGLRQR